MENDKYYIPNIEDLFVGYECQADDNVGEFAVEICATEERLNYMWLNDVKYPNAYYKSLTGKDISRYEGGNVCHNGFIPLVLRTKYLDKEDIESLGWRYDPETDTYKCSESMDGYWELDTYSDKTLYVYYYSYTGRGKETQESCHFDGNCPSKNELKKLMKLLDI